MKIRSIQIVFLMMWPFLALAESGAVQSGATPTVVRQQIGGAGPGGGRPMFLQQVEVGEMLQPMLGELESADRWVAQTLRSMLEQKKIVGFLGDCKIVGFPSESENLPKKYWFTATVGDQIIVDPDLFKLSRKTLFKVLKDLAQYKVSEVNDELSISLIDKGDEVLRVIDKIRAQLTEPLFQKWMIDSYNEELTRTRLFQVNEKCFVNANNQSASIMKKGYVVGVRGFTRIQPGADIYFSSDVLDYGDLGLMHIIAAEVGHHLPIGPEAANEETVDQLASVITLGNESIQSKAIMFDLNGKLLIHNILSRANVRLPVVYAPEDKERVEKIKGEIPPAIRDLRNFLISKEIKESSQSVFNGFNDLFGKITMTSFRSCAMSNWNYAGIEYDRMVNKEFTRREPTEMERIMFQLEGLDSWFCRQVNNVFGKSFIEYAGYGTSSLRNAEENCESDKTPPVSRVRVEQRDTKISEQKRDELKNLGRKISSFNQLLCKGVGTLYSRAIPFSGTAQERELILAVIGGNGPLVEDLLKAGVNPNIKDTRTHYEIDYDRDPQDFGVFFTSHSTDKDLLTIAYDHISRDDKYSNPHLQNADRAKLSPHMVGEADAVNLEYELFHLLGDRLL